MTPHEPISAREFAEAIRLAVAAERKRCAKIAEACFVASRHSEIIAARIRAGG